MANFSELVLFRTLEINQRLSAVRGSVYSIKEKAELEYDQ